MARRSIEGYRPLAVAEALRSGRRLFPDTAIEAMIAIAGAPPPGPFKISVITRKGNKYRSRKVSGRASLEHHLEKDARALVVAREHQRRPTARQLEKKFAAIATTARRLLNHLEVGPKYDVDDMPTSLLSGGLLPFAVKEAQTLNRSAKSSDAGCRLGRRQTSSLGQCGPLAPGNDAAHAEAERRRQSPRPVRRNCRGYVLDDYLWPRDHRRTERLASFKPRFAV